MQIQRLGSIPRIPTGRVLYFVAKRCAALAGWRNGRSASRNTGVLAKPGSIPEAPTRQTKGGVAGLSTIRPNKTESVFRTGIPVISRNKSRGYASQYGKRSRLANVGNVLDRGR